MDQPQTMDSPTLDQDHFLLLLPMPPSPLLSLHMHTITIWTETNMDRTNADKQIKMTNKYNYLSIQGRS